MGILDDAIREHLDLKRRLGAEADELARLEGEAFGPPSRPGDPDFPDQPPTGESAVGEQPAEVVQLASDMPAPAPVEPPAETPPEVAETVEPTYEEAALVEPPLEEPISVEPASEEVTVAEQVFDEPVPEPPAEEELPEAAVPLARELRAIVDPPPEEAAPLQEVRPEDELDLDLDLELDEPEAPDTDEQPAASQPITGDAPIEGMDTVEHRFEGAIEDTGEVELVEGEIAEEPPPAAEHDGDEEEDEAEDVLEETPEFLREKPEDDELWFEQGEPKDFDF